MEKMDNEKIMTTEATEEIKTTDPKTIIRGTTESGFDYEIDKRIANDMELLEQIAAADKEISLFPALIKKMLGEEQKDRLYDHVRDKETGTVPINECISIFNEIMNSASEETKNS